VIRKIGRGGQGDVYLAHDPNLDIDVAVKVLLADYRTEEILNRFTLEARTAVRLTAENIVRVYNFNPSYPCLVMEYCGDGDLNGLIKSRRQLPLRRAVNLIRQICNALIAAHERSDPILHRDLKPGNVLFQKDVPKVADFGLAKVLGDASSGLTSTRGMMGTVAYTSPEQLKDASAVDHRTDIWSLGVMLYELLTFRGPFEKPGDDYVNVAIRVRTEPPADPPYEIPQPLWEVIQRSLQKDPKKRFGSAREMGLALDAALAAIPDAESVLVPAEETLSELDRMASRVADSLSSGSTDHARTLVERMRELSPEDSLVRYWDRRLQEVATTDPRTSDWSPLAGTERMERRLGSIEGLIVRREYREARRQIGELLIEDPDNARVHDLILRVNKEEQDLLQALGEAHDEAQRVRATGDLAGVEEIWRRMDDRFPECADVRAELAVASRELELERQKEGRASAEAKVAPLLEAADLEGALQVWDEHLERHPGDGEAGKARNAIHAELAARTRAERLASLWKEVEELSQAGELEPTLERVLLILSEDPDSEKATELADYLRTEVAAERRRRRKSTLHHELLEEIALLGRRLGAGRYQSVERAQERLNAEIDAARGALDGELEEMVAAEQSLASTCQAMEDELAGVLRRRQDQLRGRIDAACKLLREPDRMAGSETEVERALREAIEEAVSTLGAARPHEASEDPVGPLLSAERALCAAAEALAEQRRATVERLRSRATDAVAGADRAVSALRTAPAIDTTGTEQASRLEERLAVLRSGTASDSVRALEQLSREATALTHEAESALTALSWSVAADIRRSLEESLDLVHDEASDRLRSLVVQAARALDGKADAEPQDASSLATIGRELRSELDACREARQEQAEESTRRWRAAEAQTPRLDQAHLEPEFAERVEEVRREGAAALAASRWREVRRRTAELEGLVREGRLRAAWTRHREAVEELELAAQDEPDGDYLQGSARQKLLDAFRGAAATGSVDELGALGAEADQLGRKGRKRGVESDRERLEALLNPSSRVRRLNRRLAPAALERFDEAAAAHRRAGPDTDSAEASRLATEVERAHDALLRPPPAWNRIAYGAVAVLAVVAVVTVLWSVLRIGSSEVTLVSPFGEVEIVEIRRDGDLVDDLPADATRISPAGTGWVLEPGEYAVTTEHGLTVRFAAPRRNPVLIPGESVDHRNELLRELELDEPELSEEP
jgi:serine/threonine protein kinase